VIGVEPAAGDDATRSFKSGTLQTVTNPATIADGARTSSLGTVTFPLVMRYVYDMLTVTDEELIRGMLFLWERLKIVVEPTGALASTALLESKLRAPGARIGVIVSGGNVELQQLARWI
jgi:threonine dehydratase